MELEINKILIKLPQMNEKVFLSFPFLTLISELYPKSDIYLIVEEGEAAAFAFLPFKVRVFERPITKKNLIETHHFVANHNEIFNIDIFFDLENTFNSAFMGFNFRAKQRIGYELGWNKHLLTHKIKNDGLISSENNFERYSINLLEKFMEKNFSDLKIANSVGEITINEKIDKLFNEPEPPKFILIMLDNFSNVTKDIELWKSFFDSFEKQKFIIWTLKDEDIISEIFAKIDLDRNELFIHRGVDPKELNYILRKVVGVITNNTFAESLCGYYNLSFISFVKNETSLPHYQYFKFRPLRIYFNEQLPVRLVHRDENREFKEMNEVADFIHFNFKL